MAQWGLWPERGVGKWIYMDLTLREHGGQEMSGPTQV